MTPEQNVGLAFCSECSRLNFTQTLNLLKAMLDSLCTKAFLGFGMVTLHTAKVDILSPTFNFTRYNPRVPPKAAVELMSKQMEKICVSDEHFLTAAVSHTFIKDLGGLSPTYSTQDYITIPYVEFSPTATVFFLTGGTRNEASKQTFLSLQKSAKQKESKQKKTALNSEDRMITRSELLFKVSNWVVQLYDFGMYIKHFCLHILTLFIHFTNLG